MKPLSVLIGSDACAHYQRDLLSPSFCDSLWENAKPLLSAVDFRVLNLECALRPENVGAPILKSGPNLWGRPENVSLLSSFGADCAILANNHFGDYGPDGAEETLRVLDCAGIARVGGGSNLSDAYRAWYAVGNGLKIAFLAVCENEFGIATESSAGSAGYRQKMLADRIREEKETADFVVVLFHGGNERDPVPSPDTVDRYRLLADFGADAVVAMHTHCMQGTEVYRSAPIIYSMGNCVFYHPDFDSPDEERSWYHGYFTELRFAKGEPVTFVLHPYVLRDGGTRFCLLNGAQKDAALDYISRLSAPISDRAHLCHLFDAWCLGEGKNYARQICYLPDYEETPVPDSAGQALARMRNLFTCEAHSSLLRNLLCMELDGRMEEARAYLPELEALSRLPDCLTL